MALTTVDHLISYTSNNGTVLQFQTFSCNISATTTSTELTGRIIDFPHVILKQNVWTKDVPNATVLESLVNEAAQHELIKGKFAGLVGGAEENYSINANGAQTLIYQDSAGRIMQYNPSTAAKKLEAFVNANCK